MTRPYSLPITHQAADPRPTKPPTDILHHSLDAGIRRNYGSFCEVSAGDAGLAISKGGAMTAGPMTSGVDVPKVRDALVATLERELADERLGAGFSEGPVGRSAGFSDGPARGAAGFSDGPPRRRRHTAA